MSSIVFNSFKSKVMGGVFNLSAADPSGYNIALTSGYTPDIDNHTTYSDVSSFETTGIGYTTGGQELSGMSLSYDAINDRGVWDALDVEYVNSTITSDGAVLYKDSDGSLICYVDFGSFKSSSNGTFKIVWNNNGILALN